jgi:hypothetical protein
MIRVSLVSETILGVGSQVNPRFESRHWQNSAVPTEPRSSGQAFAKPKNFTGIQPPIRTPFDRLPNSSEYLTIVGIPYDPRRAAVQLPGYFIALTD